MERRKKDKERRKKGRRKRGWIRGGREGREKKMNTKL
jgi:hypothetical protein